MNDEMMLGFDGSFDVNNIYNFINEEDMDKLIKLLQEKSVLFENS